MDNEVASSSRPLLVPAGNGFAERLVALPAKSKLTLVAGLIGLVVVLTTLTMSTRQGDYKLLFANLSEKDGGLIIEKLQQMNVDYRLSDGNGAIMVPASKVYELRMKLTSSGLPRGDTQGYDLLDKSPVFGRTQLRERMDLQRAREGELIRTIGAIDSVASARVHLAMPNQNGFFREQERASASVVLTLHPGRTLDRAQISGIVHLVSGSVPDLKARDVSIIDSSGALLNPQDGGGALDSLQLEYRKQIEASHLKRVLDLLEPVVGRDNLRATVTADIDFAQIESTAEEYKPNQGNAPAAIRRDPLRRVEPARRQHAQRRARRRQQPATGAGHRADQRRRGTAAGRPGRQHRRQRPARGRDPLRSRQDRAGHAQCHRRGAAPECRGGREPQEHDRRQGQDRAPRR